MPSESFHPNLYDGAVAKKESRFSLARAGNPGKICHPPGHGAMNKRRAHEIRPVVLTAPTAKILLSGLDYHAFWNWKSRFSLRNDSRCTDGRGERQESFVREWTQKMASLADLIVKYITPHVRCAWKRCIFLRVSVDFHPNEAFRRRRLPHFPNQKVPLQRFPQWKTCGVLLFMVDEGPSKSSKYDG